jgi:hypothetical protein
LRLKLPLLFRRKLPNQLLLMLELKLSQLLMLNQPLMLNQQSPKKLLPSQPPRKVLSK